MFIDSFFNLIYINKEKIINFELEIVLIFDFLNEFELKFKDDKGDNMSSISKHVNIY